MAFRRIITRTGNSPVPTFPTVIKNEFDRLVSIGTVTRTEVFVTDPAELIEQNVGSNKFKSTITEVWTNEAAKNSYVAWVQSNHKSTFDSFIAANGIVDVVTSSGEI
jgi:hypothetical protein